MESSIEILGEYLDNSTYEFRDLLVMLYHIYNVNSNHPFIPIMQSLCVKQLQEGLNEEDCKGCSWSFIETFFFVSEETCP